MEGLKKIYSRDQIQSGDLLVWDGTGQGKSSIYLQIVRFLTVSDYGHVSVAWRQPDGMLTHVEATQPSIRVSEVLPTDSFYCVPLQLGLSNERMDSFFKDKIGLKYSFRDAAYAYLGLTPRKDDRWQCVELANAFFRTQGLSIGEVYVPGEFVHKLMAATNTPLVWFNPQKE